MEDEQHLVHIRYDDFLYFVKRLQKSVDMLGFKPDAIVTFPRGGLVPASHFAYHYDVPVYFVTNTSYHSDGATIDVPLEVHGLVTAGKNILIVDDIVDTGGAIRRFFDATGLQSNYLIATIAVNMNSIGMFDNHLYATQKWEDEFVVFPWEQ